MEIAQEISNIKIVQNSHKIKNMYFYTNKLIFRLPRWGILRYCSCFHQKDKFVNWACQVRHIGQSFSFVVQL